MAIDILKEINRIKQQVCNLIKNSIDEAPVDGEIYGRQDGDWVVINEESIPEDFFIATQLDSSSLLYQTDTFRQLNLQPYVGTTIINTNEIVRNGNDIFVVGNYSGDSSLQVFLIGLFDCRIKDDVLVFSEVRTTLLSAPIHGLIFHNDYLYSATITTTTTITKINPITLQI